MSAIGWRAVLGIVATGLFLVGVTMIYGALTLLRLTL